MGARIGPRRIALALALAGACLAPPAARAGPSGPSHPPEWKYVVEDDDKAAEALLVPLLKKYDAPAKCTDLLKILRGKRAYPSGLPESQTIDLACSDGRKRSFTYLLPKKGNPRKPTPVVVFLHGAIRQPAPGGGANEARLFGPAFERLGAILVGPSTYEGVEWGNPACRGLLRHALDWVKGRFNVDENRVFLAGDSDGGRGTYAIPETEATFYAAAVPVIGAPGGVTRFANLKNLPWLAINTEKDSIFTLDHVREAVDGMKVAGLDLTWRMLEGKAHDPYVILESPTKEEVGDFLAKHPRDPYPKEVHWEIDPAEKDVPPATQFRWIRIERTGDAQSTGTFDDAGKGPMRSDLPRVHARREGNRIDVDTRGVQAYTVLLSDSMVDLSKEVEIRTNGNLSFRGTVVNDARAILEEARRLRDRTMTFNARLRVEVDEAKPDGDSPAMGD